jgi:hypothetical protein
MPLIGQTLINWLLTTVSGREQPVRVIPGAEVYRGSSSGLGTVKWSSGVKYHDTDVGFLCPLLLPSS